MARLTPHRHEAASVASVELTVVVPTRNERDNVGALIARLAAALAGIAWEVVFVDDDSDDGTGALVRAIANTDHRVRCLSRIGRRGLASACVEGILSSAAPYVAIIDGDLQHDESLLPAMLSLAKAEQLDLVVGSRYLDGGTLDGLSPRRQTVSRGATWLAHRMMKAPLSDPLSGFFLMRRATFDGLVRRLSGESYKILLDIFMSSPTPLKVRELPYRFRPRHSGESKLDGAVMVQFVLLILDKLFGRIVPVRFILFAAVGGFGVAVHMAALAILFRAVALDFTWAQAGATLVAMTSNFMLNNLLTYRDRRLRGLAILGGLLSFYAICSVGVVANVGIATVMFEDWRSWWVAGFAGTIIGSVWNYAMASTFTWRRGTT